MPSPNNVNILISVSNKASQPLRQVKNEFRDFRDDLVKFNRRLFTASALVATFTMGFRKAFQLAAVGADFDMFREQFNRTFGADYFKILRNASKYTMDAMSIMQLAVQNHARGLSKYEQEKIFTLSVGAAKLLGTSTKDAAMKMSQALQTMSVSGMKQFMVALNVNNQFKNMELFIGRLTKGLNAAGKQSENFKRVALRELELALGDLAAQTGDTKTMFMVLGAGLESFKQTIGNFLARALAPLSAKLGRFVWEIADKLKDILDDVDGKFTTLRKNIVNFMQISGGFLAISTGLLGVFSMLALVASTFSISITGLIGLIALLGLGFKTVKDRAGSWTGAMATMGATLKAFYQAFTTYEDGWITLSGEVTDHIKSLPSQTQNTIFRLLEFFALLRVAWEGFTDGIKSGVHVIASAINFVLKPFKDLYSLFGGVATQFSTTTEAIAKTIGHVVGFAGVFLALKSMLGGKGGILSKIPIIGRFFGGKKPSGTAMDPIYTRSADGVSGFLGQNVGSLEGILNKIGMSSKYTTMGGSAFGSVALGQMISKIPLIGKTLMSSVASLLTAGSFMTVVMAVVASFLAGYGIGTLLDKWLGLSDKVSNAAFSLTQSQSAGYNEDIQTGERAQKTIRSTMGKVTWSPGAEKYRGEYDQLTSLMVQGNRSYGGVNTKLMEKLLSDNNVSSNDMLRILDNIRFYLQKEGIYPGTGKPNRMANVKESGT
jgi:hypothetical protein